MNSFVIFANPDKDLGLSMCNAIKNYIEDKDGKADVIMDTDGDYEEILKNTDAVIVLGGDGTMLRASRLTGCHRLPMLGINLGTLGFLAEVEKVNVYKAIDRLIEDDYELEERMMIEGTVGGKTYHSLNDIVISRAGFSRVISLDVYVNDQLLDTYEADGVIVATPTGSTGYNLSAGGPIVSPKSRVIVVTPISPHSLTSKSVVFDSGDRIRIRIGEKRKTQNKEAIVSFDGDNSVELSAGDEVFVSISDQSTLLIKLYDVNFYSVLRDKIGG